MKVSDFYPIFYTKDVDAEVKRFTEIFGFTVKHEPKIEFLDYVVMENDKKRRVDLVYSRFPADSFKEGYLGMRANVDNFEEGLSFFNGLGYTLFGTVHENASSITALLTKNGGTYLVLFHHKK